MQLHQIGFYKKSCFTRSRTSNHQNIFIPGILGILWPAGHGQPFCLCKNHIVIWILIHIRLNILGRSPSGRTILHSLTEFLCINPSVFDNDPYNNYTQNSNSNIQDMKAWKRLFKCLIKIQKGISYLLRCHISWNMPIKPADFIDQIPDDEVRNTEDQLFLHIFSQRSCPRSFCLVLSRCLFLSLA